MSQPNLSIPAIFNVSGKIALVTGGSSGIGYMITSSLAQNGAKVYIASRNLKNLEQAATEINALGYPGKVIPIVGSLGTMKECKDLANSFKSFESELNLLFNNSGMSWGGLLEDFDEKNGWDRLFSLNVKSVFYLTVELISVLEKGSKGNDDPARVINISSIASIVSFAATPLAAPGSGTWPYNASKAAVNHLTRSLALSLASKNITVNAIAPGVFPSRMTKFGIKNAKDLMVSGQPLGRIGIAEDIAGIALFLSAKASAHITGTVIPVDGGSSLGISASSRL